MENTNVKISKVNTKKKKNQRVFRTKVKQCMWVHVGRRKFRIEIKQKKIGEEMVKIDY